MRTGRVFLTMVAVLAMAGAAGAQDEFCSDGTLVDSYSGTENGFVNETMGPLLENGKPYLLTVRGTMSVWPSSAWSSICLGAPEDAPIYPSPGSNGKVGMDPAYYFAVKNPSPLCASFNYVPYEVAKFAYKLGAAGTWDRPRPENDVFQGVTHSYEYPLVGDGQNIFFSIVDDPAYDNYGKFCFVVEEVVEDCVGDQVALCAGQNDDIGTVDINNDGEFLYVTFSIDTDNWPGWYLEETHVAVGDTLGDIPQTGGKNPNPIPGAFLYGCDLEPMETSCTVEIPLGDWCVGDNIVVAAHAAVVQVEGDGCDTMFWAADFVESETVQGLLWNGNPVSEDRSYPSAALGAPDWLDPLPKLDTDFFSLGFGGSLAVDFGYPVYNGVGDDICVQEITNYDYPLERAEVFGVKNGTGYVAGVVTNDKDNAGYECVDLASSPTNLTSVDFVKLIDATDPGLFNSRPTADGYDVDAVGACYLLKGEETAWGDGCDGERFNDRGNWGTYFSYMINDCAECGTNNIE